MSIFGTRISKILALRVGPVIVSALLVAATVSAATTISTNIDTGGTLGVTGNATLTADIAINGGDITLGTGSATSTLTSAAGTLGVSSTTPWGLFSIESTSVVTSAVPIFVVGDQGTSTPMFVVNGDGRVGVASTTPYVALGVTGTTTSSAGAVIGLHGSNINQVLFGTCTFNPGIIEDGKTINTNCVSATGVTTLDKVFVTPVNLEKGLVLTSASSTANDTIQLAIQNATSTSVTPDSRSWNWMAIR